MPKGKKSSLKRQKQDLDMAQLLEVSERKFKIIMIPMLKPLMENRQHARSDR